MKKSMFTLLITGFLATIVAACEPPTATSSGTVSKEAATDQPLKSSASMATSERSAYSEVALSPDANRVGADPKQITLKVFGHQDLVQGNFQEEVVLKQQTANQALVTLTQTGLPDDSVEGMRYRLEFIPEGNQWRLIWAGRQVRCYPGRGTQSWTTTDCR
ncbi:MAG: hypothetical protein ACKO24_02135 [Leptolyngbyaceae cyanobacterium]